jgi:hypothetical protein
LLKKKKFLKNVTGLKSFSDYLSGPMRPRANDDNYIAEVRKVLRW